MTPLGTSLTGEPRTLRGPLEVGVPVGDQLTGQVGVSSLKHG